MQEKNHQIPAKGRDRAEILQLLKDYRKNDPDYKQSRTWSLVYYLDEEHSDFLSEAYNEYSSANGLNPAAFQSLKKFETEVIRMTANLLNGDRNVSGIITAGGTESCLLAVKTYRDLARATRGVKKPEMILPTTAHVAWDKGAEYFNVKIRRAPLRDDYCVDPQAVKKMINKNTVMILGSAPEYPHGMIDPIAELGEIAQAKNIPLHVDACVGGFILPFIEKLGNNIPLWDYRVPGVTSISADIHKYGFSAKGASTITYRNIDIMKHQFFVYEDWPGGVFASPGLLGTRPGGSYSAAWAALQTIGEEGYLKLAAETLDVTRELMKGVESIPELEIIAKPLASLFAYKSKSGEVSILAVGDQMEKRGWHVDRQQKPEALHAMVTPRHRDVIEKYIQDLRESVAIVKANPELANTGGAAMYGMIANIPMRGMVRKNILNIFAGMYGPDAKMIDPDNIEAPGPEGENGTGEKPDLATRAGMFYLKLRNKFKK